MIFQVIIYLGLGFGIAALIVGSICIVKSNRKKLLKNVSCNPSINYIDSLKYCGVINSGHSMDYKEIIKISYDSLGL